MQDNLLEQLFIILEVNTLTDAIVVARQWKAQIEAAPDVLSINAQGKLRLAPGMTVGAALRLLGTAQAQIDNVVIAQ